MQKWVESRAIFGFAGADRRPLGGAPDENRLNNIEAADLGVYCSRFRGQKGNSCYVQAAKDRLVKPRCGEEIRRLKPDTVLTSILAPHLVLQRQPQQTAEVIAGFIRNL